jgi:hypothetical protein
MIGGHKMKFEANVVYPDGTVKKVKNLGYILRNWKQIEAIQVDNFVSEDTTRSMKPEAFMSVDFTDGRIYTTGFMSKAVLVEWLDRPVLRGLSIYWFGKELTIGKDKLSA